MTISGGTLGRYVLPNDRVSPHYGGVAVIAIGCLVVNIALVANSDHPVFSLQSLLGTAFLWVCASPLVQFALQPQQRFPMVPIIAVIYFIAFGQPVFRNDLTVQGQPVHDGDVIAACGLALVGVALMIGTQFTPMRFPRIVTWPRDDDSTSMRFALATLPGVFFRVAHERGWLPESMGQVLYVLAELAEVGALAVFVMLLRRRASTPAILISGFSLAVVGLIAFGSGAIARPISLGAMFFFAFFMVKRRTPWKTVLILIAAALPFQHAKLQFRAETSGQNLGLTERANLFVDVTQRQFSEGSVGEATDTAKARVVHLGTFAYVIDATPDRVPYWGGETYASLLWGPIPRFIAPDKPKRGLGQAFGHRYEILDESDYETTYNLPQVVELYANFGTIGVLLGMILIGIFYRFVAGIFDTGPEPPAALVAVGSVQAVHLFQIECDFSLINGAILYHLPVLWFLVTVISWRSRRQVLSQA